MMIAYGHEVAGENDPYTKLAEATMAMVSKVVPPGTFLVNVIPSLRYIPKWFPGSQFHAVEKEANALFAASRTKPYAEAKAKILNGTARPSMTARLLEEYASGESHIPDEDFIADLTGIVYIGAADTTTALLHNFVLAMISNPEAQRRAQEEIDRVVESERLPEFGDKVNLPYVEAIFKECLRWNPITPAGVAHLLTEDDSYNGYFIPEGTIVIPNAWLMLQDPIEYPQPESFVPERFLTKGSKTATPRDPTEVIFGFGRRICPGRHFAADNAFIMMVSILSSFTLSWPVDKDGSPKKFNPEFKPGLIMHPLKFECKIEPRSEKRVELIRNAVEFEGE